MIYYLRDKDNKNLAEVEVFNKAGGYSDSEYTELHSCVYIAEYSNKLISILNQDNYEEFIKVFDSITELKGWLWNVYYQGGALDNEGQDLEDITFKLELMLKKIAEKWDLIVVED